MPGSGRPETWLQRCVLVRKAVPFADARWEWMMTPPRPDLATSKSGRWGDHPVKLLRPSRSSALDLPGSMVGSVQGSPRVQHHRHGQALLLSAWLHSPVVASRAPHHRWTRVPRSRQILPQAQHQGPQAPKQRSWQAPAGQRLRSEPSRFAPPRALGVHRMGYLPPASAQR